MARVWWIIPAALVVVAAVVAGVLAVAAGGRSGAGPAGEPASFAATPFPRPAPADHIVGVHGTLLLAVPPGASAPRAMGTVPERTYLLEALTAG